MIIRSRAPVRISFGGGGTDVSPYTEEYGGCALNAAIRRYAWATLELRRDSKICLDSYDLNDKIECSNKNELIYDGRLDLLKAVIHSYPNVTSGFNLFLRSDFPPRSGLGGSASAFVAVIGVFNYLLREYRQSSYEIAETAYHLEREVLKIKGGRQDQYVAVFGGINLIEFKGNDFVRVNTLRLPENYLLELEKHLVLVQLPDERGRSDNIIIDQTKRAKKKGSASLLALHKTKEIAHKMKRALLCGKFDVFGDYLDQAWHEKKQFSPYITNKTIDRLYDIAKKAGAIGGKITGAGGGGHMLFFCKSNKEQLVINELVKAGAKSVDLQFDTQGLQTWTTNHSS